MLPETIESLFSLPTLWEKLQNADKPIVLYGMGDGADKILAVCEEKWIPVDGVFVSDDFYRKKTFHGFPLMRYRDAKERFGEMIVLLAFATRLDNVMQNVYTVMKQDELYAPFVPVYGKELFTVSLLRERAGDARAVFLHLADDVSRKAFLCVLAYRLTGDIRYLSACETSPAEAYRTIIRPKTGDTYVDVGAYNGDTLKEYVSHAGTDVSVIAFEPDIRNYRKLSQSVADLPLKNVSLHHAAAWDADTSLSFEAKSGRAAAANGCADGKHTVIIPAFRVDSLTGGVADYIKIDAEGTDMNVLRGMTETVKKSRPTVCCAAYHRTGDLFDIPLFLAAHYPDSRLFIRHFPYIPDWDTNVYIRPNER